MFKENIKNILSSGGSEQPNKLLLENGIDINKPEFWQNGFDIIKGWLKEL